MPDEFVDLSTNDDLEAAFAALRSNYAPTDEQPAEPTEDEGEEEEGNEGTEDESEESEPPAASDDVEIDGTVYKKSELAELTRLRDYLNSDPSTSANLQNAAAALEYSRQQAAATPPGVQPQPQPQWQPPAPPEGLDLEDPAIKSLWEQTVANAQQLEYQRQELVRRNVVETQSNVERAVTDWNGRYKLDDTTIANLRQAAAQSGVAAALEAQGRPIYDCITSALESAFWANPSLRNQYLDAIAEDTKRTAAADKSKQRKLASLSGRGSSVGSTKPPRDMTSEERHQGVIDALTEAMSRT